MLFKQLTGILLLLFVLSAVSCAHKSPSAFQAGKELQGQQQYTEAITSYTQAIADKKGNSLVAAAYFYRGECYERTGDFANAYRDFYTAQQLSCKIMNTDKSSNTNSTALGVLAQSTLCNDYGPKAVARVEPKLQSGQADSIRNEVDSHMAAQ